MKESQEAKKAKQVGPGVLITRLVRWLSWVFANQEGKKEKPPWHSTVVQKKTYVAILN